MIDATAYTISIRRGEFDNEICYEARVKELPDLVEYADTHAQAYELAMDAIITTAELLAERNRHMPAPQAPIDEYSGRVTLRLPKTLHRSLASKADYENISLNQLLVTVLSTFRGFDAALQEDRDAWVTLAEEAGAVSTQGRATRAPDNVIRFKQYAHKSSVHWG